mmetsp:Transcript_79547/g.230922  ORF Transcript_79547/g.230922 Transcript_79547/m.230922 type:complete len:213 (-) Transcript_79547:3-641(-)
MLLPTAVVQELGPAVCAEPVARDIMCPAVLSMRWHKGVFLILEANHTLLRPRLHELPRSDRTWGKPTFVAGVPPRFSRQILRIIKILHGQVALVDRCDGGGIAVSIGVAAGVAGVVGFVGRWVGLRRHGRGAVTVLVELDHQGFLHAPAEPPQPEQGNRRNDIGVAAPDVLDGHGVDFWSLAWAAPTKGQAREISALKAAEGARLRILSNFA